MVVEWVSAGVECDFEVELELGLLEFPLASAYATTPPSTTAAIRARTSQNSVPRPPGGRAGGTRRVGGGVSAATGTGRVGPGGSAGGGATARRGLVGSVAAIDLVGSVAESQAVSRSRTSSAVCGRSSGDLASISSTSASSAGGTSGLRALGGLGATRTCW